LAGQRQIRATVRHGPRSKSQIRTGQSRLYPRGTFCTRVRRNRNWTRGFIGGNWIRFKERANPRLPRPAPPSEAEIRKNPKNPAHGKNGFDACFCLFRICFTKHRPQKRGLLRAKRVSARTLAQKKTTEAFARQFHWHKHGRSNGPGLSRKPEENDLGR